MARKSGMKTHHGKYGGKAKPGRISGKSKHAAGPVGHPGKKRTRKSEFGG